MSVSCSRLEVGRLGERCSGSETMHSDICTSASRKLSPLQSISQFTNHLQNAIVQTVSPKKGKSQSYAAREGNHRHCILEHTISHCSRLKGKREADGANVDEALMVPMLANFMGEWL